MGEVVVFEQAPLHRDGSAVQAMVGRLALSARHLGLRVVGLPYSFDEVPVDDALDRVPGYEGAIGFLAGFISDPSFYAALYDGARERGITMINAPDASRAVMEFDRFYPRIADLTARSVVVRTPDDCDQAIAELGSPVFVKGLVKSRKEAGWQACLARDASELRARLRESAHREISERGVLIAREILDLRQDGHEVAGFPVSREYRAYVLDGRVLGHGFYWRAHDSFGPLSQGDAAALTALAREAARRVDARLVAVDVGQLVERTWRVIELGDPQFSGVAHMAHHVLWHALQSA